MDEWKDKIYIPKGESAFFRTGVFVDFQVDCWFLLKDRSGAGFQGLFVLGGVGDPGYRGEICITLGNIGGNDFVTESGTALVQMILIPRYNVERHQKPEETKFNMVGIEELSKTDRGEGGFGSTNEDKRGGMIKYGNEE
jgi:dUTP pyrophosphatase